MAPFKILLLVTAALTAAACAGPVRYVRPDRPPDPPAYALSVWIDDHPLLDLADVVRGCIEWRAKGVICRLAADPASADVRISVDDKPCVPDAEGLKTLALAYHDGRIVFMPKCFDGSTDYVRRLFRAVMTHEVGHEVGIWEHVPLKCDGKAASHDGRPICGPAVMNRLADADLGFVTVVDSLAFEARAADDTRLRPLGSPPRRGPSVKDDRSICVFRSK